MIRQEVEPVSQEDLSVEIIKTGIVKGSARIGDLDPQAWGNLELSGIKADNTIALYFKEAGREPLLNFQEEIDLARTIEAGREAERRLARSEGSEDLSSEESLTLKFWVQVAEAAGDRFIKANTRLVVSIAKKYRNNGVPFLDLIQEGNLGLMKAVEKFDYRRGNRFSTYATWWIRQAISRALVEQGAKYVFLLASARPVEN